VSRKPPIALLAAVILALIAVPPLAASGPAPGSERASVAGDFVPGEVIVRFEGGANANVRRAVRRAADVELDRKLRIPGTQLVEAEGGVAAAVKRLERDPDVAYAQPNYRYEALAVDPPDDTFFGDLWGLGATPGVDVLEGWETTRGAGQVIAILDTGVALDHPDLEGNLWSGPGGIHGHDFVDNDNHPDDYDFHGTHVAGTAAAIAGDNLGVAGVAPQAEIMAVRVLDGNGSGSSADIAEGIDYASFNGADVINMSLGGPAGPGDELMSDAVALADHRNVVVVAAAGNDDGNDNDSTPTTPCTLPQPNLICVAAVTETGDLASFSNVGATTVDVGAPGTDILSARNDYGEVLAESFASGIGAWTTSTVNGGLPWSSVATPNSDGNPAATDSDGGDYANADDPENGFAESRLVKTTGLDLSLQRGCRMHFDARYDLESGFDFLEAGAVTPAGLSSLTALYFTGMTGGNFFSEEVSISDHDGEPSVSPWFTVLSDATETDDGAYVDDLRVLCRTASYVNDTTPTGNYVEFDGTSMATPHVAGVAALVRAADPGAPDTQVVTAIKNGGAPLASLGGGNTVTGRTADAEGAISTALAIPNPVPVKPASPAGPTLPPKPNLAGAKRKLRASKSGRFSYRFKATPGMNGSAVFKTVKKVKVSKRARVTLARRSFSVIRADGAVTVAVKLSKKNLKILERNRRLVLNVTVTVRNFAGLKSQASKRLTLLAPKRR
jgi:thermitase